MILFYSALTPSRVRLFQWGLDIRAVIYAALSTLKDLEREGLLKGNLIRDSSILRDDSEKEKEKEKEKKKEKEMEKEKEKEEEKEKEKEKKKEEEEEKEKEKEKEKQIEKREYRVQSEENENENENIDESNNNETNEYCNYHTRWLSNVRFQCFIMSSSFLNHQIERSNEEYERKREMDIVGGEKEKREKLERKRRDEKEGYNKVESRNEKGEDKKGEKEVEKNTMEEEAKGKGEQEQEEIEIEAEADWSEALDGAYVHYRPVPPHIVNDNYGEKSLFFYYFSILEKIQLSSASKKIIFCYIRTYVQALKMFLLSWTQSYH